MTRPRSSAAVREPHRPPRRGDDGFTLIELLIVLVIMPLVVGAIAMVLIATLKNDEGVDGTVADSSAATLSSSFYTRDIASAGEVTTTASPGSPPVCSADGLSGTTKFLLGLQLQGATPPTKASEVSYYEWTPFTGAASELVREFCTGGSSTPRSHEILSDNLSATNPPVAVVPCASPTPTSVPTGVACDTTTNPSTTWIPTYMVSTVTLNVTQGCSTVGSCAPYQFAMSGDPQSGVPIATVTQPCGVLTLLGTGIDINLTASFLANESLSVQGPIVLNSGYNTNGSNDAAINSEYVPIGGESVSGAGVSSCPGGSAGVPSSDAIGVYNCNNTSSSGASTNYTACPTSGQHTTEYQVGTVSPSPVQISTGATQTGISDPLLNWADQNPVPTITSPAGSCSGSTTLSCTPGLYSSGLSIASNVTTVNFASGNYQFGGNINCSGTQTSLCIQSSGRVNFGAGDYTYLDGIDVVGSGTTLCGSTTASSACPTPLATGTGVFFYVKGGDTNLGNTTSGATFELSPCTTVCSNSNYANVVLWQDGDDNDPVLLNSGTNNIANSLGGVIYAPTAQIQIVGWSGIGSSASVNTEDIVANTLAFSGAFLDSVTVTVDSTTLPS